MVRYATDNWTITLLWRVVTWVEENYGKDASIWYIDDEYNFYIAEEYELFFLLAFSEFKDTCRL